TQPVGEYVSEAGLRRPSRGISGGPQALPSASREDAEGTCRWKALRASEGESLGGDPWKGSSVLQAEGSRKQRRKTAARQGVHADRPLGLGAGRQSSRRARHPSRERWVASSWR